MRRQLLLSCLYGEHKAIAYSQMLRWSTWNKWLCRQTTNLLTGIFYSQRWSSFLAWLIRWISCNRSLICLDECIDYSHWCHLYSRSAVTPLGPPQQLPLCQFSACIINTWLSQSCQGCNPRWLQLWEGTSVVGPGVLQKCLGNLSGSEWKKLPPHPHDATACRTQCCHSRKNKVWYFFFSASWMRQDKLI